MDESLLWFFLLVAINLFFRKKLLIMVVYTFLSTIFSLFIRYLLDVNEVYIKNNCGDELI